MGDIPTQSLWVIVVALFFILFLVSFVQGCVGNRGHTQFSFLLMKIAQISLNMFISSLLRNFLILYMISPLKSGNISLSVATKDSHVGSTIF